MYAKDLIRFKLKSSGMQNFLQLQEFLQFENIFFNFLQKLSIKIMLKWRYLGV